MCIYMMRLVKVHHTPRMVSIARRIVNYAMYTRTKIIRFTSGIALVKITFRVSRKPRLRMMVNQLALLRLESDW